MLSYISLNKDDWLQNSYLALCGVADISLFHFLSYNKNITSVVLCLDNDTAGLEASRKISQKLSENGYTASFDIPQEKDWNDQLYFNIHEQQGLQMSL